MKPRPRQRPRLPPCAWRKQVERVAIPQIPAPPRRTLGFSCSALPVERHSCRTRGCTWNTSSDRDLSSGRCLPAGRSRPCTQRAAGCILWKCLYTVRDWLLGVPSLFTYFVVEKLNLAADSLVGQPTCHFQNSAGAQPCTIPRQKEHNSDFYQQPV